ncbi:hypothetical protein AYI68_g2647 [Smittium mucronatum]|uniref:Sulfate transporter n=1 Tax=Smittium mucronatum TaxID=133383 RepID=A0A1R0H279_9FUNG|nr:hypothetical protein AYI68_g2647 [Smittium mucronatum]
MSMRNRASIWSMSKDELNDDIFSTSYNLQMRKQSALGFTLSSAPESNPQGYTESDSSVRSRSMFLSNLALLGNDSVDSAPTSSNYNALTSNSHISTSPGNLKPNNGILSSLLSQNHDFREMPELYASEDDDFLASKKLSEDAKLLDNYISSEYRRRSNNPQSSSNNPNPSLDSHTLYNSISPSFENQSPNVYEDFNNKNHPFDKLRRRSAAFLNVMQWPIQYIPAVFLGLIFNLLDGISYGLITFPLSIPVYQNMGPVGLSMFFVSTIICQLVLSSGLSAFRGANGLMMVEVIPFLYQICDIILKTVGTDNHDRVIATTLVSYALSSIMTGVVFLLLGALKIGKFVDFFPRHILVGCIGGVGYFLTQTGFEVMAGIPFQFNWPTLISYFQPHKVALWGSALSSSLILRVLNRYIKSPMLIPAFCVFIPVVFYVIVFFFHLSLENLRSQGWVFAVPDSGVSFYHYLTLFDFRNTDWLAVWRTVPTMIGLSFFGILHVPINVPALSVSIGMNKLDTDRELFAHGISNFVSGILGSFQNYLVYSNSVLFYKSGGDSRLAGFMLAAATFGILLSGPSILGYIPTLVVGMLIFHLGIELMKEALYDTWDMVNSIEYFTICMIVATMALVGFNEGILLGIILACLFFILLYSNRSVIWKSCNGLSARSTVRRLYKQKLFLDQVVQQIQLLRLQGFMFFGTINFVEDSILSLLKQRQWEQNPIRFLIIDFMFVTGMDFSAAEAFIRLKRILKEKKIHLVICGVVPQSEIAKALIASGVWSPVSRNTIDTQTGFRTVDSSEISYVHTFSTCNSALEWCENYLLEYYVAFTELESNKNSLPPRSDKLIIKSAISRNANVFDENMYSSSPRLNMLSKASKTVMDPPSGQEKYDHQLSPYVNLPQNMHPAIPLLARALQQDEEVPPIEMFMFLVPFITEMKLPAGKYLWHENTKPKGLYLVRSGVLTASISSSSKNNTSAGNCETNDVFFPDINNENILANEHEEGKYESIIAGTLFGELSLFTGRNYNNNVFAEIDVDLFFLSSENFEFLCESEPKRILQFVRKVLVYTDQYMSSMSSFCY